MSMRRRTQKHRYAVLPSASARLVDRSLLKPLDVTARAHADGSQNLPATNEPDISAVQREIVDRGERAIAELREHSTTALRAMAAEIDQHELTPADLAILEPAQRAEHLLVMRRESDRASLRQARESERELFRELRHFKVANHLTRRAHYPRSQIMAFAVSLGGVILAETLLNARLFAEADALGWLGGWMQAVLVSVFNVMSAFLYGMTALRNLGHVSPWRRVLAAGFTIAGGLVIGGYNLFVAHLRLALTIDPDHAKNMAVNHFIAHPLDLSGNTDALYLLALGLLAAIFAAIDGYCLFDDRYPGYGRVDRRYRAMLKAYDGAKARARRELAGAMEEAGEAIDQSLIRLHDKVSAGLRAINDGNSLLSQSEQTAAQIARLCERQLRTYREENKRVRTTPAPVHFEVYPIVDTTLDPSPVDVAAKKQRLLEVLGTKIDESSAARSKLRHLAEREEMELASFLARIEVAEAPAAETIASVRLIEARVS